jgi:hypothetical protein
VWRHTVGPMSQKFAPKKLKLFNFNRLPHQVRQAARA